MTDGIEKSFEGNKASFDANVNLDDDSDSFDFSDDDGGDEMTEANEREAIQKLAVGRLIDGASDEVIGAEAAERLRSFMSGGGGGPAPVSLQTLGSPTWNGRGPDAIIQEYIQRAEARQSGTGAAERPMPVPEPASFEQSFDDGRTDTEIVADGYNMLPNGRVRDREKSLIKGLKDANGWVKKVLIRDFTRRGDTVLDLCCGRGGDMHKWTIVNPRHVVFADSAEVSLRYCQQRFEETRSGKGEVKLIPKYTASFVAGDCFQYSIRQKLPAGIKYDVISCQMALHYSFASKASANEAMKTIASLLQPRGFFICTLPDSEILVRRLLNVPADSKEPLKFGNKVYSVAFDSRSEFPAFGSRYTFKLVEAVNDLPEYLVKCSHLCGLAEAYGLKLVKTALFDDFIRERPPERPITLSDDEKEVFSIYRLYAFQKAY